MHGETLKFKVSLSIPDGVTGIFHWLNPFGCVVVRGYLEYLLEVKAAGT